MPVTRAAAKERTELKLDLVIRTCSSVMEHEEFESFIVPDRSKIVEHHSVRFLSLSGKGGGVSAQLMA